MKNDEIRYPVSIGEIVGALRLFCRRTKDPYEQLIMTEAAERLELTRDIQPEPVKVKPRKVERNDPLTLEELRQMEGEPVWVNHWHGGEWIIVYWDYVRRIAYTRQACLHEHEYGETWIAYRNKPKEA